MTKELDFVLYNSSLSWDNDDRRRELYGKPGSFRPKPYGVEYRVLSNMWLKSISTQKFVFDAAKAVASKFLKGDVISFQYKLKSVPNLNVEEQEFDNFCEFLERQHIPSIRLPQYNPFDKEIS